MFTEKRIGALIYDEGRERMDIRFGLEEYYGGLHCGTGMEVMLDPECQTERSSDGE